MAFPQQILQEKAQSKSVLQTSASTLIETAVRYEDRSPTWAHCMQ